MLKNMKERQKYIEDNTNWSLVTEIRPLFTKVYVMSLPNGVGLIKYVISTHMADGGMVIECTEYRMLHKDGISVPWRFCEVIDYLKEV